MKRLCCLVLAMLLSACGLVLLVPEESVSPTSGPSLVLAAPFTFVPPSGPTRGIPLTLAAGEYRPALKDKEGTFYRGPDRCVKQVEWKATFNRDGGIWLPHAASGLRPKIFVYDANTPTASEQASNNPPSLDPTPIALQATPAQASPGAAGLGAGIAYGLMGALAQPDPKRVLFITDPFPAAVDIEAQLKAP